MRFDMTITLKNVTKKIRGNTVVDHIDLTLSSGMVYTVFVDIMDAEKRC